MSNKIALCFIINYNHELTKEHLWKEWIEPNKDKINIYFYYGDFNKIKSNWIKEHCIPKEYIVKTSYYHIIPAYFSLMNYVVLDTCNKWFCFLTETCCPIIPPTKFIELFNINMNKSIMSYGNAYWNTDFHKRANLKLLPSKYHLYNSPWFILTRNNVYDCLKFISYNKSIYDTICNGGLANESLFAIIFQFYNKLNSIYIINQNTHLIDWSRMKSSTSPHLFELGNEIDIHFIKNNLNTEIFIRKISNTFPDAIIRNYVCW